MQNEHFLNFPYPSKRNLICGSRGAVSTSNYLASIAGMEMYLQGGNSVDAAIAMAASLTVVEPTSNGIGSDAFAIVCDCSTNEIFALDASGKSPRNQSRDLFNEHEQMPTDGWKSILVPGAVSAWSELHKKFGRLPFANLFAPAIRYAREGFIIEQVVAKYWKLQELRLLNLRGKEFEPFKNLFYKNNRAPKIFSHWHSDWHADTLIEIAQHGAESFYRGSLAKKTIAFSKLTGGYLCEEDLAEHKTEWIDPISTNYRGLTVWEIPPATQGISTLLALNILEAHPDFTKYERDQTESFHLQIEAMKLAFADVYGHVGDRNSMKLPVEELLAKSYAKKRQSLITKHALQKPLSGFKNSGTVYLCASDKNFHVSFIQSNYMGFGSGILIPETGISLQNRAACFTLEKNHPNEYAPNKKSFHTIIPGFLSENDVPIGPFGIMGGAMQPQAHLQFVVNVKDFHLNPQAALDAPRWLWNKNNEVLVEPHFSSSVVNDLIKKGHNIKVEENLGYIFGAGQAIFKDENGVFFAATDYRKNGAALAW